MKIIEGRGRSRKTVIELPHASVITKAPEQDQVAAHNFVCGLVNVDPSVQVQQVSC